MALLIYPLNAGICVHMRVLSSRGRFKEEEKERGSEASNFKIHESVRGPDWAGELHARSAKTNVRKVNEKQFPLEFFLPNIWFYAAMKKL